MDVVSIGLIDHNKHDLLFESTVSMPLPSSVNDRKLSKKFIGAVWCEVDRTNEILKHYLESLKRLSVLHYE